MSQFRRGYNRIVYLTGIGLVLIALGIEYFQYQHNQRLILIDLKNRLTDHHINTVLRVKIAEGAVRSLKMTAENTLLYIKKFGLTSPLFPYLKNDAKKNTYSLDINALSLNPAILGNFQGVGSIETISENVRAEINMALFLNTFFEGMVRNTQGAIRAYYISKNHFQSYYPYALNFKGKAYDSNHLSLQQYGSNFWTSVFQNKFSSSNSSSNEFIVTNSSPIFNGKEFLGLVSLDFTLFDLGRNEDQALDLPGLLLLINEDQQILSRHGGRAIFSPHKFSTLQQFLPQKVVQKIIQELKHPSHWFSSDGDFIFYVTRLADTPWFNVYVGSKSELFKDAFFEAVVDIFVITITLIFVVGMGYLIVIRDFISPAQKLVEHIAKENRGVKSIPQNLPPRWRKWFDIVSRIFRENRMLLMDLENRVKVRTKQLQQKNQQLETTLTDLKKAQDQIIVHEKLASLGSLTAGIAHEIKNPLNFIINFSELSLEYLHELKEKIPHENQLFSTIEQNISKTREHAERADSIVKSMLAHARGSTGEITTFNLNKLLEESIELAYIGFQGKENDFTAKVTKSFDQKIADIQGSEQDLARVFLNIVNNACFAMYEKQKKLGPSYKAELKVKTRNKKETIEIIFEDNGPGMTRALIKKIFHPFFTTKESGKGTGLGLSLSYDIITQQHHGHFTVESKIKQYSRFIIEIPKRI